MVGQKFREGCPVFVQIVQDDLHLGVEAAAVLAGVHLQLVHGYGCGLDLGAGLDEKVFYPHKNINWNCKSCIDTHKEENYGINGIGCRFHRL